MKGSGFQCRSIWFQHFLPLPTLISYQNAPFFPVRDSHRVRKEITLCSQVLLKINDQRIQSHSVSRAFIPGREERISSWHMDSIYGLQRACSHTSLQSPLSPTPAIITPVSRGRNRLSEVNYLITAQSVLAEPWHWPGPAHSKPPSSADTTYGTI